MLIQIEDILFLFFAIAITYLCLLFFIHCFWDLLVLIKLDRSNSRSEDLALFTWCLPEMQLFTRACRHRIVASFVSLSTFSITFASSMMPL